MSNIVLVTSTAVRPYFTLAGYGEKAFWGCFYASAEKRGPNVMSDLLDFSR